MPGCSGFHLARSQVSVFIVSLKSHLKESRFPRALWVKECQSKQTSNKDTTKQQVVETVPYLKLPTFEEGEQEKKVEQYQIKEREKIFSLKHSPRTKKQKERKSIASRSRWPFLSLFFQRETSLLLRHGGINVTNFNLSIIYILIFNSTTSKENFANLCQHHCALWWPLASVIQMFA